MIDKQMKGNFNPNDKFNPNMMNNNNNNQDEHEQ